LIFGVLTPIQQYFSYIMATSFSGGGSFSNISAISWRLVLVVEEAGIPRENHQPWEETGKLYHLRLRVECNLFCILQSQVRT